MDRQLLNRFKHIFKQFEYFKKSNSYLSKFYSQRSLNIYIYFKSCLNNLNTSKKCELLFDKILTAKRLKELSLKTFFGKLKRCFNMSKPTHSHAHSLCLSLCLVSLCPCSWSLSVSLSCFLSVSLSFLSMLFLFL